MGKGYSLYPEQSGRHYVRGIFLYAEQSGRHYGKGLYILYIQNSPAATMGKGYSLYPEQSSCHYGKGIFLTSRTVWLPLCERDILVRVAAVGFFFCIGQNPCRFCFKQCNL